MLEFSLLDLRLRSIVGLAATVLALTGCDEKNTYPVTFTCAASTPGCSQGQICPTLPLDAGGCEELPGLFGNASTPVDAGRPLGCVVGLSYGNPHYEDGQQHCTCGSSMTDGGAPH
jgi:hypothetical protein